MVRVFKPNESMTLRKNTVINNKNKSKKYDNIQKSYERLSSSLKTY